MRFGFILSFVTAAFLGSSALYGTTAMEAVRILQQQKGVDVVNKLVEVRGERGDPQPRLWTIVVNDSEARGGIREFVIAEDQVVSERAPVGKYSGVGELPILDYYKLNVDSDKAFQKVNEQAIQNGVGFHWIDYALRADSATHAPVWTLQLYDYMGASVAAMQVSAESADVTSPLKVESPTSSQAATVPSRRREKDYLLAPGGVIGKTEDFVRETSSRTKRGALQVIGNVQEWLTGERTIGEN